MIEWNNTQGIFARSYVCGYCGNKVAPTEGLSGKAVDYHNGQRLEFGASLHLCVHCGMPTVFVMQDDPTEEPTQTPAPAYGDAIPNLPEKVEAIYNEARDSMTASAFTGVAMLCRSLVAHIAVEKGAATNKSFQFYVQWLDGQHGGKHFLPPDGATWVNHIRDLGNDANHDLVLIEEHEAKELIDFSSLLLRIVYDYPTRMAKK